MNTPYAPQSAATARLTVHQTVLKDQLVFVLALEPKQPVKEAIILLHGWRSEGAVWHGVMEKLASEQIALYALDLPGFGRSEPPKTPFSVDSYADIVFTFLEQNGVERATFIGHSFGGRIGIHLAAEHPDFVQKLILVDSAGIRVRPNGVLQTIARFIKPLFRLPGFRALRPRLYHLIGADDYLATPAMQQTFVRVISEDLSPLLGAIHCPTLIVWGDSDKETPLWMGQMMAEKIVSSRLVVLPEAGHFCFLDQPDRFLAAVRTFLDEQS